MQILEIYDWKCSSQTEIDDLFAKLGLTHPLFASYSRLSTVYNSTKHNLPLDSRKKRHGP
jgi:hypothetical protein